MGGYGKKPASASGYDGAGSSSASEEVFIAGSPVSCQRFLSRFFVRRSSLIGAGS
ncbi:hypothetical protein NPIL_253051, partial [Nephila pilipes]